MGIFVIDQPKVAHECAIIGKYYFSSIIFPIYSGQQKTNQNKKPSYIMALP